MSATKGSAVATRRLIGCCMLLALLVSALFASSASAKELKPTAYVALGDSISFGYKEQTFNENYPTESPSAFEGGFVGWIGKKLAAVEKKEGNGLATINLACPGETSGGLIGNGPLGQAINQERKEKTENAKTQKEAEENFPLTLSAPCAYHNVDGFKLKTEEGSVSELEYTLGLLEAGVNIKAVTLQIGSNDELETVGKCLSKKYQEEQGFVAGQLECIVVEAGLEGHEYPGGLFTHIIVDTGVAIGVLREVGHYYGPIAILGFYNPQSIILPGSDPLQENLNAAFEGEVGAGAFGPGVTYNNPFPIFNKASPKKPNEEQESICKWTEECNRVDQHYNFVKYLEKLGYSHAEAEGIATYEESEAGNYPNGFPEGDIHPTAAGYKKLAAFEWTGLGH
jgi:hypothetical protein